MDGMTPHKRSYRHAAHDDRPPPVHARTAAWLVLVGAGLTTMSFNIWHAIHGGMPPILAPLEGMAPVLIAMGLSHVISAYRGGWFLKAATFGVMLAAMVLSLAATGNVVRPALGPLWWLFGATVDAAALLALQVILSPESRAAAAVGRKRNTIAPEAVSAVPEPVPVPVLPATLDRSSRGGPQAARTARRTAPADDLAMEAQALKLLAGDLTMSGAALARALGVSESYGRKLRRRLTQPDRPAVAPGDRPAKRDRTAAGDRAGDRS